MNSFHELMSYSSGQKYYYCIIIFFVGDEIVEVTVIDDGWMEGRVKRTGKYGMLPSNYVDKQ